MENRDVRRGTTRNSGTSRPITDGAERRPTLHLDQAHTGPNYDNINPRFSRIPSTPQFSQAPGGLMDGTRLLGRAKMVGKVGGVAYKTYKVTTAVDKDLRKGTTKNTAKAVTGIAMGSLTGAAGSMAGACIGTAIFPGVGTAIGGFIGGAAAGYYYGNLASDAVGAIYDVAGNKAKEVVCKMCGKKFSAYKFDKTGLCGECAHFSGY